MNFLFLFALFAFSNSTDYPFPDITIKTTISSTPKISNSSSDTCREIVVGNLHVFHLNTQDKYQCWNVNNLQVPEVERTLGLLGPLADFDGNEQQNQLIFLSFQNYPASGSYIYEMNQISLQYQGQYRYGNLTLGDAPFQVFVNGSYTYQFYGLQLLKRNIASPLITQVLIMPILSAACSFMSVSHDYSIAVIWNSQTSCFFVNLTSMSLLGSYTPPHPTSSSVTHTISFSRDNKYAIIETDRYNPVIVLSLDTFTVLKFISLDDVIFSAFFLDDSNQRVVVLGQNSTTFFELSTNKNYAIAPIVASIVGIDNAQNVYSCSNNIISRISVSFVNVSQSSNASNTNNTSNHTSPSLQSTFYQAVSLQVLGNTGQTVVEKLNVSLQTTIIIANKLFNIAISTPITVYFLGFLNFVSTSGLYLLLNFPIPEHVYHYLQLLYNQIGSGLLSMININFSMNPIGDEKVSNVRALFFGVSSDIISSNKENFILFAFNIILLLAFKFLFRLLLAEHSFVNQLFNGQMKFMIYGQIIGLLQPLILPWKYALQEGGIKNFNSKLNTVIYIIVFLLCIVFPFYYFLQLKSHLENKRKLKQSEEEKILQLRWNQAYSVRYETQTMINDSAPTKSSPRIKLLNGKMLEEWFLCQTNIIYPLFVIINNPVFFLIIIGIHNVEGIIIAARSQRKKVNKIFLASYPMLFHISFIIFYWSSSVYVLAIAQIICFVSLLLGFVHNITTIVFDIFVLIFKLLRHLLKSNRVGSKEDQQGEESVKQSEESVKEGEETVKENIQQAVSENKQAEEQRDKVRHARQAQKAKVSCTEKKIPNKQKLNVTFSIQKSMKVTQKSHHNISIADNRKSIKPKQHSSVQQQSVSGKTHKITMKKAKANKIVDYLVVITKNKKRDQ